MTELENLPNIGKVLAAELREAGIRMDEDLRKIGSVDALLRMNGFSFQEGCLNKLFALEGAIQGLRWHNIPKEARNELKKLYFARIGK